MCWKIKAGSIDSLHNSLCTIVETAAKFPRTNKQTKKPFEIKIKIALKLLWGGALVLIVISTLAEGII